jgi:Tol biopolymer transport system component
MRALRRRDLRIMSPRREEPEGELRPLPWAIAACLGLALALVVTLWAPWQKAPPPSPLRLKTQIGADASLAAVGAGASGSNLALSPDGATLAFVAQASVGRQPELYLRRLDRLQAVALTGTGNAHAPFFSPDGNWIAFFADGKLKKVSAMGGAVSVICDALNGYGGDWGESGTIVFASAPQSQLGLRRVSSAGGPPESLTELAENESGQLWPQILPGGEAVLYTSISLRGTDEPQVVVQQLPKGDRKVVRRSGHSGRYLRSGHLVHIHNGTLFAEPFDLERLEATGQAAAAVASVSEDPSSTVGPAQFAISAAGTLAYVPAARIDEVAPIQWLNREGTTTTLSGKPVNWSNPQVSPDGRRVAVDILDGKELDIWIFEDGNHVPSRLTLDPADDIKPVWTPDGRRVAFASRRDDMVTFNLYWERTDGSGDIERLATSRDSQYPGSWHPTGRFLAFQERAARTNFDVWILPIEGDEASRGKPGKPTVFLNSAFDEREPIFSPDGRWLAYQSNESGRDEVYVRAFAAQSRPWRISTGGGFDPAWSRTRSELLFVAPDGQIMVASYAVEGEALHAGLPRPWGSGRIVRRTRLRSIDLHPDGERVVGGLSDAEPKQDEVVLVLNFLDELRRIAPPGGQ